MTSGSDCIRQTPCSNDDPQISRSTRISNLLPTCCSYRAVISQTLSCGRRVSQQSAPLPVDSHWAGMSSGCSETLKPRMLKLRRSPRLNRVANLPGTGQWADFDCNAAATELRMTSRVWHSSIRSCLGLRVWSVWVQMQRPVFLMWCGRAEAETLN